MQPGEWKQQERDRDRKRKRQVGKEREEETETDRWRERIEGEPVYTEVSFPLSLQGLGGQLPH